jgi:hypothetical protein
MIAALLGLFLAAAPGCPAALAEAAALPPDDLAAEARPLVRWLESAGGAGPFDALHRAAAALEHAPDPSDRERASAAFRSAVARHCALAGAAAIPGATARDRAELAAVLARPELAPARDPFALRRLLRRLWERIVELLGTSEAERYASAGRAVFLAAAAAAAVLALAALRRRRVESSTARPAAFLALARRGPDASAASAEEALRRGDAREAVRQAFLAALAALERAGRVPPGRALTNGEIVAMIATSTSTPTMAEDVATLARAFDRAVYGGLPVAADAAAAAVRRARSIAAGAGGGVA